MDSAGPSIRMKRLVEFRMRSSLYVINSFAQMPGK
jgi:hypothetical protein